MSELDSIIFTCNKCGNKFDHTQGTWLPIGEEDKLKIPSESNGPLTVLSWSDWLKPPEVITSDDFMCYNCI